ncbi:MAG: RNA-binding transcriptional accessory protein [Spirochaetes bacterium]|nr:RNA-binding transcriptional accessory protein [Spirochaetota bacterium]
MADKVIKKISSEMNISVRQVEAVIKLLNEDATVPFISRYRKEATGGLDEVSIISIRDRYEQLQDVEKRRAFILKSIDGQGKLTEELKILIEKSELLSELEDIYLPYKPKKRTRATVARENGLEPLALSIFNQQVENIYNEAAKYINVEKNILTESDALDDAADIIAEMISENAAVRSILRNHFFKNSEISSCVVKSKIPEAVKYKDYFNWSEKSESVPSHRILAMFRGFEEGCLKLHFLPDEKISHELIAKEFKCIIKSCHDFIIKSSLDAYKRLLAPSLENEIKTELKKRADVEAIRVFSENIKELLLASPLGEKNTLAVDPGQRTGCKVVVLSKNGNLVADTVIYPLEPHNKIKESAEIILDLCGRYKIEAIAVGNGTGGRESLAFCKSLNLKNVIVTMVNESGASVYSASEIARQEFPDYDVTVRGAVSIGRRLMDPLAELVKIDPKSIGVGQYQHDVDQKMLKQSLTDSVMNCVNNVGVELNTASVELLKYVSGLSRKNAEQIVRYRTEHGQFKNREELKKVSGMGDKTYEQAAGFLRIRDSDNPLDASSVHPESYHIVEKMAEDSGCTVIDLMKNKEKRMMIIPEKYVSEDTGLPTLKDILKELEKPGRDPRNEFELFSFSEGVNSINDLIIGMKLSGVVTNVTAFGAFVDIGVHQDGLVHISELSNSYVKNATDVVKVNQKVSVTVMDVDIERRRISLSMKQ